MEKDARHGSRREGRFRELGERQPTVTDELVDHSDRGAQYLSIRSTDRLLAAGIEPSVGCRGDSYDNALAESVIGLCSHTRSGSNYVSTGSDEPVLREPYQRRGARDNPT